MRFCPTYPTDGRKETVMSRPKGAKDKQKRVMPPTGEKRGITKEVNTTEEYNADTISFIMSITPTEPLDPNDLDEMKRRFQNYLEMCVKYGKKVGNQAAYMAIGVDKGTVWDWINRNQSNPQRSDFFKKVQQICGVFRENLMADGKVNPVTGIFWQKNYDGMKDQQEVVLTPNNPLGEQKDAESLRQKYLENTLGVAERPELPEGAERAVIDVDLLPAQADIVPIKE